ncbi:Gypsy retrotransposon integrase-like protein 1 [Marasmius tenuissimus]|nr:Gypsy retrotransposon integrase-like protein 1 [Marasmius tenuissimus]
MEMLVNLANHARSLDRQLSLSSREVFPGYDTCSTPATASPIISNNFLDAEVEQDKEVEDSVDELTAVFKQVTLAYETRHVGKSSYFMLIQSAMDARRGSSGDRAFATAVLKKHQRPEFWKPFPWEQTLQIEVTPFVFPEDDLLHDLINIYFTRYSPFFPILHQPTFRRLVAEGLHLRDRPFGATVLAVCALASRQSNDPRTLCEGTTSEHSLGWKYFRQIPLMRDSFTEPPTVYDIQICSLCVYFLDTASTPEAAWALVGVGIRSAQEVGLHRKRAGRKNTVEDELWRRAFWMLVCMDVFMSSTLGRPRAMTPDDFDCELPSECDDEYWEHPDPKQAFVQPEGKPSTVSFFVTSLRLLEVIGFAQRSLYSDKKSPLWSTMGISEIEWKRKAVVELDSAMNKFMDEIPGHLRWDPDMSNPIFFQQSAMLYSTCHWVHIQIHRPFIARLGQAPILPFPSLTICTNATRKTIHILETLQTRLDRGTLGTHDTGPYMIMPLFVSALILLVSTWRPQRTGIASESQKEELADVYRCMELISKYESRYQVAGRLLDILNAVIAVGQLSQSKETLKRPRSAETKSESCFNLAELGPGSFSSQTVTGDLHTENESLGGNPLNQLEPLCNYGSVPPSSSGSYSLSVLPSAVGTLGVDPLGPPPVTAHVPVSGGGQTGDLATANDYMLHHQPDTLWYTSTSSSTENADFTQEEWNSFMSSVDDIVNVVLSETLRLIRFTGGMAVPEEKPEKVDGGDLGWQEFESQHLVRTNSFSSRAKASRKE